MKHIDEIYKEWCGEHHTTNSGYPVHDSAEATDFAQFYHKEMVSNIDNLITKWTERRDYLNQVPNLDKYKNNEEIVAFSKGYLQIVNELIDDLKANECKGNSTKCQCGNIHTLVAEFGMCGKCLENSL